MTTNDHLDNNLKKLLSSDQTVLLAMPTTAKGRILNELTRPKGLFNWRKIMGNRIVKFFAAAVLVLLVLGGVYHFKGSVDGATPAWAIQQTIEAMKDVKFVHILGTMYVDKGRTLSYELWAIPNPEGTESDDLKFVIREKNKTQIIVVYKNISYDYHPDQNTVTIRPGKQYVINPWLGSKFFEIVKEKVQDLSIAYEKDPQTGRETAIVTGSYAPMVKSFWFQLDQETKRLIRFKQWNNVRHEGPANFIADTIIYDEQIPKDFFKFQIPKGARVKDLRMRTGF